MVHSRGLVAGYYIHVIIWMHFLEEIGSMFLAIMHPSGFLKRRFTQYDRISAGMEAHDEIYRLNQFEQCFSS